MQAAQSGDARAQFTEQATEVDGEDPGRLSRRGFLLAGAAGIAAVATASWMPSFQVPAGAATSTLPIPPKFPAGIALYQQAYQNWSEEIQIAEVWTCAPKTAADVVTLANWAHTNNYTLRPRGSMHGWTPLTVVQGASVNNVILADTTQYLTSISVNATSSPATVTAGAGATMDAILQALENAGLGLVSVPAPGDVTIAGALTVNAHGAAFPALFETQVSGTTYGSLSNLVTALTAVVWNPTTKAYVLETYQRSNPAILPLLTHLGRTFITSVTLQAGKNYRLRCQSYTDISTSTLFGPPGTGGATFSGFLAASGRLEAIWFPFTSTPWLKVWTPTPTKPSTSTLTTSPYNYTFSDGITQAESDFIEQLALGQVSATPSFGATQLAVANLGLAATNTWDIWGWSKNTLLYILPSTLRLTEGGGAVLTNWSNVQQVVNDFYVWFSNRIAYYEALGQYPINGPVEIRCCGLDQSADVKVASAGPPTLSSLRPRPDHPEWNVAVWLNVLSIPGTPNMWQFYTDLEQWMTSHYTGTYATFRPEWSKGWAFTAAGPYKNTTELGTTIPSMYRAGVPKSANWDSARAELDTLDPNRVFSNTFINTFLP